jgi:hypothetical protein
MSISAEDMRLVDSLAAYYRCSREEIIQLFDIVVDQDGE